MGVKRYGAVKYCAYGLMVVVAFVLQSARATSVTLLGVRLDALPMLVAAVALYEGPYAGGSLGFFAGLLVSIHSPMVEGLSALYLGLFGVGFGVLGAGWLRRVCPAALLGGLGCVLFQGLARYVFFSRLIYGLDALAAVLPLAAELALAVPPGILYYYIVRAVHRRFTEE